MFVDVTCDLPADGDESDMLMGRGQGLSPTGWFTPPRARANGVLWDWPACLRVGGGRGEGGEAVQGDVRFFLKRIQKVRGT